MHIILHVLDRTRYTPGSETDVVTLDFRIAEVGSAVFSDLLNPLKNPNLKQGLVNVEPTTDWIAKIDVTGLKSNTFYYFAFTDGVTSSDVGRTRTAPARGEKISEMRYAVFSCSKMNEGYFHA